MKARVDDGQRYNINVLVYIKRFFFCCPFCYSLFLSCCTWILAQKSLVRFGGLRPFSSRFFISFLHLTNSKITLIFDFYLKYFLYSSAMRVNSMNGLSLDWQYEELLKSTIFILKGILCSCFSIKSFLWMRTHYGKIFKKGEGSVSLQLMLLSLYNSHFCKKCCP